MTAEHVLTEFAENGVSITLDGSNLQVRPSSSLSPEQRAVIKRAKAEIVGLLVKRAAATSLEFNQENVLAMLCAASPDEFEAMRETLFERISIIEVETGLSYEDAMRAAEADLFPLWIKEFKRRKVESLVE